MFSWLRHRRRQRIIEEPFPPSWRATILHDVASLRCLSKDEWATIEPLIQVFIAEKTFEGCAGLVVEERMKVTIAAQACLLILSLDHDMYRDVETILIYPTTFVAPAGAYRWVDHETGIERHAPPRLGEAHAQGPVILAWDDVLRGAFGPGDGHNLVFHEFAHKLDQLDGHGDGTPPLNSRAERQAWHNAMAPVFLGLKTSVKAGRRSWLDPYATTNEAEFFAVATESFFERPRALKRNEGEVYDVLKKFYKQDPLARITRHQRSRGR